MIFSAISIPGLHDGTKTVTRRLVKSRRGGDPVPEGFGTVAPEPGMNGYWEWLADTAVDRVRPRWTERPRFLPGERVYACEAIEISDLTPWRGTHLRVTFKYVADGRKRERVLPNGAVSWPRPGNPLTYRRSPPYVPRWAARTGIEVVDVWPERLQDITAESARAEGLPVGVPDDPRLFYRAGWELLHKGNPDAAWARNPWVWVYTIKVINRRLLLPAAEYN